LKKQIAEKAPHLLFLEFHHAKDKLFNLWVHIGSRQNLSVSHRQHRSNVSNLYRFQFWKCWTSFSGMWQWSRTSSFGRMRSTITPVYTAPLLVRFFAVTSSHGSK